MTLPAVAVFVGRTLAGQSLATSKKSLPLWPVREAVLVEVMGSSRGPSDGGASVQQVGAITRQSSGKSVSDSGDPLGQDREAVRKACPKSCRAGASCASQTASAQVLRKLGLSRPNGPGNPVSRRRVGISTNTQQPAEGLQHTLVVPAREGESLAWRDGAQQVVDFFFSSPLLERRCVAPLPPRSSRGRGRSAAGSAAGPRHRGVASAGTPRTHVPT